MQETQVCSLGQEDPLEKEMATHSSILAWRISWTEEPGGLQSTGLQRVGQDWAVNTNTVFPHLLKKVKEETEKAALKLNIQKTKIMAYSTTFIDGETMETVTDFIFLGSKITEDGDCSHEIKRCLLLERKAMT